MESRLDMRRLSRDKTAQKGDMAQRNHGNIMKKIMKIVQTV